MRVGATVSTTIILSSLSKQYPGLFIIIHFAVQFHNHSIESRAWQAISTFWLKGGIVVVLLRGKAPTQQSGFIQSFIPSSYS